MVYNETVTRQREDASLEENPYKVYVAVYVKFLPHGAMEPFAMEWKDGKRYFIDRVLGSCRMASRKAGGCGIRYLCMINGHRVELFYEENYRWFVTANE